MSRGDFWSRRKARVAEEAQDAARSAAEAEETARAGALAEKSDAEICAELGLPDPDSLEPGEGIAAFMRREIPERLRRRALRKLWGSNPVLACVDGLNDYDDDYTNAATDMPGVKTAYEIGRGMRAHVETLAAEAEAEAGDAAPEALAADAGETAESAPAVSPEGHGDETPGEDAEDSVEPPALASDPARETEPQTGAESAPETPSTAGTLAGSGKNAGSRADMQDQAWVESPSTTKVAMEAPAPEGTPLHTDPEAFHRPRRMRFDFEERE
ncbi:DUF3306 domain-containing protein [Roseivivax sp. GX 12232]|uniref:DUF3306 domain-containing protein n=1 Tax=Roseivivax sp. GX 12232 TaxID=2900547 RepID=UPI001E48CC76|nr:DUF3306 domain-containing protein [Roseivivax sp. GX 12232]MCE0505333.1 DUF3306 domain-containing protein [Roseivivax sp. GX 12232]